MRCHRNHRGLYKCPESFVSFHICKSEVISSAHVCDLQSAMHTWEKTKDDHPDL